MYLNNLIKDILFLTVYSNNIYLFPSLVYLTLLSFRQYSWKTYNSIRSEYLKVNKFI